MKIAGIIAEYNPFHNGHAWHIAETRRRSGCDGIVVCMDGHFTQRGDPAVLSKWSRARMALACGADAVFELPALFAVRPADAFARGGVAILDGLGIDALSFGSEIGDMALLERLSALRSEEPGAVSEAIRRKLDEGKSHARARGEAISEHLGLPYEAVNRPNAVLAAEYLRAIKERGSAMEPCAVPRRGDYHDGALGEYASATAVRAAWARGEEAAGAIPAGARPYAKPDVLHPMDDMLLYRLRQMDEAEMAGLPDVAEGLEHRLTRLSKEASGREALLEALKCKRYTRARLSRLLTHAMIGVNRALCEAVPEPPYARLLGFRRGAEALLGEIKKRATIPVVTRASSLRGDPCFEAERRATDVWSLLHDAPDLRAAGRELREGMVIQN